MLQSRGQQHNSAWPPLQPSSARQPPAPPPLRPPRTHLSREVLEDGGAVHGGGGADPPVAGGASLQVPMDAAHGELQRGERRLSGAGGGWGPRVGSIRPRPALRARPEGERRAAEEAGQGTSPWSGGKGVAGRRGSGGAALTALSPARMAAPRPPLVTCNPALCERDTAFALAFPLSFPAFPPACGTESAVSAAPGALRSSAVRRQRGGGTERRGRLWERGDAGLRSGGRGQSGSSGSGGRSGRGPSSRV